MKINLVRFIFASMALLYGVTNNVVASNYEFILPVHDIDAPLTPKLSFSIENDLTSLSNLDKVNLEDQENTILNQSIPEVRLESMVDLEPSVTPSPLTAVSTSPTKDAPYHSPLDDIDVDALFSPKSSSPFEGKPRKITDQYDVKDGKLEGKYNEYVQGTDNSSRRKKPASEYLVLLIPALLVISAVIFFSQNKKDSSDTVKPNTIDVKSYKYHVVKSGKKSGVLSIKDLSAMNISRDTLVWRSGLEEWTKARDLPELAHLFKDVPPPLPISS